MPKKETAITVSRKKMEDGENSAVPMNSTTELYTKKSGQLVVRGRKNKKRKKNH